MTDETQTTGRRVTLACQFCLTLNRVDVTRAGDSPRCGSCGKPFLLDRPVKLTDEVLDVAIRDAEVPLLVDFYADWCAPCKVMAPRLDDIARENVGELVVAKLDTEANPRSSERFGIRGIPTLILFRGGQEVARRTGAVPREELDGMLAS